MYELDNNFQESILYLKRNANYPSKIIQKDLLLCIKEYVQHEIAKEIRTNLKIHSTVYLLMRL